jgi:hypothetical protein
MYAMQQEMEGEEKRPIRKPIINMEQESMQAVLQNRPNGIPREKT